MRPDDHPAAAQGGFRTTREPSVLPVPKCRVLQTGVWRLERSQAAFRNEADPLPGGSTQLRACRLRPQSAMLVPAHWPSTVPPNQAVRHVKPLPRDTAELRLTPQAQPKPRCSRQNSRPSISEFAAAVPANRSPGPDALPATQCRIAVRPLRHQWIPHLGSADRKAVLRAQLG